MDDDQVAVMIQSNINGTGETDLKWQVNDLSLAESSSSDQPDNGSDHNHCDDHIIDKDLEFVMRHAVDADPGFLQSVLLSQMNNPQRLENIMCEMLNIPNALELIREFRKGSVKIGDKRSIEEPMEEPGESKKQKTEDYLAQIRDMFPDADGLFLISECQQLESWEDYSRFINTVMISGVYPKKGAADYKPKSEPPKVIEINDNEYRTIESYSSEEEISSSGLSVSPSRHRRRRRGRSHSLGRNQSSERKVIDLVPPEVETVDIASDNTETYEPPDIETLQEIYNSNNMVSNAMEVDEKNPDEEGYQWETNLVDDIDNLLHEKFGPPQNNQVIPLDTPESPKAGPSRTLPHRLMSSMSFDSGFLLEKSLAEIIEEGRHDRRRSLDSSRSLNADDGQRPSTSKAEDFVRHPALKRIVVIEEVSCPEVSTTSRNVGETIISEEREDGIRVSEEWLDEQMSHLLRIFPNTDPSYLREEVAKMDGSSEAVNEFVIAKLERNDMPTRAEYERKVEMEELQNRYTKNFSIEDFLKAVPDPWKYFSEGNRNCSKYRSHSLCYLKSTFRKHYIRDILDLFKKNKDNLYVTYQELKNGNRKKRGSRRSEFECNSHRPTTIDIQFLQEVAFIENEEKIKDYIEGEKMARQIKFDEAKRSGSLLECQCCFDSEVMVEDIVYCPKDHSFCKECIVKCVEVEMGNGRCKFECLTNCEEEFTVASLQPALKPELFSKVIQAIQMEEIKAAEIEDLVQCPFCNYATIMPPEEKVMTCLNPECLKESCRLCKELNHIPLRCDEIEKSEEVKMRTFIENKMTEALVRTCYKCGKKFVKEDGCNKMTCTCGAKMCYVCRKPITGYSHFNGQGGTEYHKCPLYSTNDELHVDLVKRIAEEAKAEVLQANPQTKLIHDPTIIMPERTHERPMPGMNNGVALNFGLNAARGILNLPEQPQEEQNGNRNHDHQHHHHQNHQHHHHHHHHHHQRENRPRAEIPHNHRYHRRRQRTHTPSEDEEDEIPQRNHNRNQVRGTWYYQADHDHQHARDHFHYHNHHRHDHRA